MKPQLQRRVQRYGWNIAAEYYEDSWKEQLTPAQDKLMEMMHFQPCESVLETACGTGLVTSRIAKAVGPDGKVSATDLSGDMIGLAKENVKTRNGLVKFHRMDAGALEMEEKSFDAAICALGLMYVPDPIESLNEMYRILKHGGRAGIAVWGERKNCGWAEIFPVIDKRVATDVCPMFFQQGTGNTLEMSMKKAGFRNINSVRFRHKLVFKNDEHALMAAFAGGPVALAYRKFDRQTKESAHSEYLNSIKNFRKNGGFEIPGEFVVARGVKYEK